MPELEPHREMISELQRVHDGDYSYDDEAGVFIIKLLVEDLHRVARVFELDDQVVNA